MKNTKHMKAYLQSISSSLEYSPCGFIFAFAWAEYTHRGFPQSMQSTKPRTRDKWPKRKFCLFTVSIITARYTLRPYEPIRGYHARTKS